VTAKADGPGAQAMPRRAHAEGEAGVRLQDVGVRYPARREPALDGVDLAVRPGEIVGVAGRTGAGKSTLALLAAGFIPRVVRASVTGHATVDGIDATTLDARALAGRAGIVFSTPANQLSASKLTVREELAFGLENLGVPRDRMDARIDAVLDDLGIRHLAEREPFALSGGEQQRVAIASIVAMGTGVIVLDEPTAQLDPAGTRAVAELLRSEADAGRTILVVEHDPRILGGADRVLVLDGGRSVGCDLPGVALGSGVLGPLDLVPPTIVRLAERGGVHASLAFDAAAVAAALVAGESPPAASTERAAGGPRTDRALSGGPVATHSGDPVAAWPDDPVAAWQGAHGSTLLGRREPAAIAVRQLRHRYPGGIEALRDVDLDIPPGQAVAIVGQNGSGKTTLVKHLNGLLRPDAGSVAIAGADIAERPVHDIARVVGFVFQNPDDQLFERSVEREVGFGPRNVGLPAAGVADAVAAALAIVGLEDLRAVNPYDLGLSTRKLVALASVLAMQPAVLILDEPTTGQDGPGVARVGAVVDACRAAGRTVVAITHDMEFAAEHFERIVVMREGRIAADGTPEDVFAPRAADVLASTGLEPPVSADIGARLGIGSTPTEAALVTALARR
jgi:energy-coupling factor transporter ATP-binding protein EcfA2